MNIQPATIDKLGKLFPRLASNHDGEVIATARAIIRILGSAGKSLHDLAPAMEPIERVVYQDRVVYRDTAVKKGGRKAKAAANYPPRREAPPSEPPKPRTNSIPYEEVLEWGDYLLKNVELNAKETDFVKYLRKTAKAFKERFTLTEKQA